jgi:hypothetical protein
MRGLIPVRSAGAGAKREVGRTARFFATGSVCRRSGNCFAKGEETIG